MKTCIQILFMLSYILVSFAACKYQISDIASHKLINVNLLSKSAFQYIFSQVTKSRFKGMMQALGIG